MFTRQQRVNIGWFFSDWITLKGTFCLVHIFILIDYLNTIMATFKFVDDIILTEIIHQSNTS